jgi:riboflavin kinase / FMN adenylyltransferase
VALIVVPGTERWREHGLAGPVLTIGNFDGVHRGHRALIDRTRALAAELGAPSAVLTFDPAPRDVLRPDNGVPRIQTLERKLVHLASTGVDAVVVQPFDRALASLDPTVFAQDRLGGHLRVRGLCVGHDFRFGKGRAGTVQTLRDALGVRVDEVEAIADADGPVSSSRIRQALEAGDVALAAHLLGRPHELVGTVIRGDQRGRLIGFPTANLRPGGGLVPPNGVYAVRVERRGERLPGVANLGVRPTFGGTEVRLEVHLLDGSWELYGEELVVGLVERIRGEQRFDGVEALVAQIRVDVEAARMILA